MKREFAKLNGLGNDFVFFDDREDALELSTEQVRRLCDRHFGIGADGVILVRPPVSAGAAAYMHYINSDGTLAQMCGNGVRCFAKYLVDRGIVDAASGRIVVDTMAGPRPITFSVDAKGRMTDATVDMGAPILDAASVPTAAQPNAVNADGESFVCDLPVSSPWGTFAFTCVSMGNPHAVCFVEDWEALPDELFADPAEKSLAGFDVACAGAFFETHELFPEKANIEFASVGAKAISMRVFERGCGETLACGTGACATGVAAALTGRAGRSNDVRLLGGTLRIAWEDDGHVLMTGPARESFAGMVEI